ncbi:MAG TPA: hypothetical protein VK988_05985 [Acidimicrobiales bacterium]|nr:hypothetical protein [Acidimicrobiales bacterium]
MATALTRAEAVGLGCPATRCAWLIDDKRRAMVLALATSASSTRYSATVSGVAGSATSPRWSAQALNSAQSER